MQVITYMATKILQARAFQVSPLGFNKNEYFEKKTEKVLY